MAHSVIPPEVFFLDPSGGRALQAQIREAVVSGVLGGRFPAGSRLPSTRKLAQHLGVSRITVTLAYQELTAQGYLTSAARSGHAIADAAPAPQRPRGERARARRDAVDWTGRLHRILGESRRIEKPRDWRRYPYPFIYGQMDMTLFALNAWRDCARQALSVRDFEAMADDAASADDPMLVNYICARTLPRRGIEATPDEVLVTAGAQNALWLVAQLLSRPGFHAACEDPGYPDLTEALRWNGARVTPVAVDGQGLRIDALPRDIDAVFVTPSHHAPTAATMPRERRTRLLARAEARDFIVIEDDYDFEMSFLAPPSPALKSLDHSGRVLYAGSFSKALFPGLRLGYLVGPAAFIREARRLRALILRHPPGHQQRTVAYFLALGHYDSLIAEMRRTFAKRREIMLAALAREDIAVSGAARFGGTNLWIEGPAGLDAARFAEDLRADGVLVEPGTPFFDNPDGPVPFFRMAYSSIPAGSIDEGVARVARRLRAG